jgi:hypothetical protein
MEIRSPLTTEYVRVPVAASLAGSSVNITGDQVQLAVVPTGTAPGVSDWFFGAWEIDATTDPDTYYAVLLVGPAPGVVSLTAGNIYDVYVKVLDNPETVVHRGGAVGVL